MELRVVEIQDGAEVCCTLSPQSRAECSSPLGRISWWECWGVCAGTGADFGVPVGPFSSGSMSHPTLGLWLAQVGWAEALGHSSAH